MKLIPLLLFPDQSIADFKILYSHTAPPIILTTVLVWAESLMEHHSQGR
jgi:hypothetical protein